MAKSRFAISASKFKNYMTFKKKCEKLGWVYNHDNNFFNETTSVKNVGLLFDTHWGATKNPNPMFSFDSRVKPAATLDTKEGTTIAEYLIQKINNI